MTEPERQGNEVVVAKIVGYTLVEQIPPNWEQVRKESASVDEIWKIALQSSNPQEFFTRFELPDGSIEEDEGIPADDRSDEIGKPAYRYLCACGKHVWFKARSPNGPVYCENCSTSDPELPDELGDYEHEY